MRLHCIVPADIWHDLVVEVLLVGVRLVVLLRIDLISLDVVLGVFELVVEPHVLRILWIQILFFIHLFQN